MTAQPGSPLAPRPAGAPRSAAQRAADEQSAAEERKVAIRRLRDRASRWRGQLRDNFSTLNSDVDFDMRRRIQNLHVAMENTVDGGDPGKNWEELTGWLRERLSSELEQNHRLAVRSIRTVSVSGARFLGLEESQIVDPPAPMAPTDLSVSLKKLPPPPGGGGATGLAMNILLRAYLGFAMYFVLTNFTGLALPIVIGIGPALLLAGIAVQEERTRQVSSRRVTAKQVLRSYITEFGMYATKSSRDLLRQQEYDLRDGYEALVDRQVSRL